MADRAVNEFEPTTFSLGSSLLDGYDGPLEISTAGRKRWWHRVLGRTPAARREKVHGVVHGDHALVWRKDDDG